MWAKCPEGTESEEMSNPLDRFKFPRKEVINAKVINAKGRKFIRFSQKIVSSLCHSLESRFPIPNTYVVEERPASHDSES